MTERKATLRKRRVTGAQGIPDELLAWFAGELKFPPWSALLPGDYELLPSRWAVWKAEHPDARVPTGYEWIESSINQKGKTT